MLLNFDLSVGALYVQVSDGSVARTRSIDDNTNVDLNEAGGLVGIEVVSIHHPWPVEEILREYALPAAEAAQLRAYFAPGAAQQEAAALTGGLRIIAAPSAIRPQAASPMASADLVGSQAA